MLERTYICLRQAEDTQAEGRREGRRVRTDVGILLILFFDSSGFRLNFFHIPRSDFPGNTLAIFHILRVQFSRSKFSQRQHDKS
mmetsp:Transcript_1626/g.4892  ORF Transcript_1626/g.4892 Transcript_1626/m.4892 type:complete len:84 (+) Transcript_1626:2157-2408(+)